MNKVQQLVNRIDVFQRTHKPLAFGYAVVKKYGDDQAGYQAALVTYYAFLSLFPLLLVLTTVAGIVGRHDPALGQRLIDTVSRNFPVVGQQLDSSIKGFSKTGPALIIGIIFTIYGARGVADAFRHAANHIWHIPVTKRSGFPRNYIRSFSIIVGGGAGFLLASVIAGWAASTGHGIIFRVLSALVNLAILYVVFIFILKLSLPLRISRKKLRVGAVISSTGLTVLQLVGVTIVKHESAGLSNSYSALFATTLGLLAWIYLQVQIVIYALEVDTVRATRLWPRGLTGDDPTPADKLARKEQALNRQLLAGD